MHELKVFGMGCPKCATMYDNCLMALDEENQQGIVIKVETLDEITRAGVMFTPALTLDGKVVSEGKILSVEQVRALLRK